MPFKYLHMMANLLYISCYGKPKLPCLWVKNPTTSNTCKSKQIKIQIFWTAVIWLENVVGVTFVAF